MDKELLFKPRVPEAEVDIPGIGTVRVRGLSRGEVFMVQQAKGMPNVERKILTLGLLDPVLTEGEVRQWQDASPAGELEPVVDKIRELSGLAAGAERAMMRQFRGEPGDGVRAFPGAEAVDDGGADADDG